jgi:hypothetical protein
MLLRGASTIFLLICCILPLQSQEARDTISWNDWNFRVSPYFWFIGLEGEIYRPPQIGNFPEPPPPKYDIDVGFKDIKNSIKFALMLAGQYRGNRIVGQFNFSTLILESEAITPLELIFQDNVIELTYFGGDVAIGYRVIRNPKFEMDALGGLKFLYFGIDLKTKLTGAVEVEGARSKGWMDPTLGINLRFNPHRKINFLGYGDISIPRIGTDFSGQFIAVAQYHFTPAFYTSLGYRSYFVEIPDSEAIFSGQIKGGIIRVGFQF